MKPVALITVLALIEYFIILARTGSARTRYDVKAPATTGHEIYERYYRAQQNTVEQLMIFLPGLWLFAYYVHSLAAAVLGGLFILGRFLFFRAYIKAPERRVVGFVIGSIVNVILLLGALGGIVVSYVWS